VVEYPGVFRHVGFFVALGGALVAATKVVDKVRKALK
jgi:hypothetical protein